VGKAVGETVLVTVAVFVTDDNREIDDVGIGETVTDAVAETEGVLVEVLLTVRDAEELGDEDMLPVTVAVTDADPEELTLAVDDTETVTDVECVADTEPLTEIEAETD
jgi:hypothetical protein